MIVDVATVGTAHEQNIFSPLMSQIFSLPPLKYFCVRAIMSMDARDQFPVDMVEQMLKFTPSPEERALLDEHADEIDHLARADRFLFELSK